MSTLQTNTIQTSSGGPVTLTKQSAAKQFMLFDQRGSFLGSANTLGESLNTSSVSDDGTGIITASFVNSMSTATYPPITTSHYNGLAANNTNGRFSGAYAITTSSFSMPILSSNSGNDDGIAQTISHGDLA